MCYLLGCESFKNDENAFYFILKAFFVLQIFRFLSRLFGHVGKTAWLEKIRLTSKFMASQRGLQTIAIHIFPNISQTKGNQAMKCGQLIEYYKRTSFLQNLYEKWGKETSSRPLFIFLKKLNMRWKQAVCRLVSLYISLALNLLYNKNKLYKTLDYWSRENALFWLFRKGSGANFSTTFCVFFKRNVSDVTFY